MNHEEYQKRRAELLAIRDDSLEAFDKSVLTLSTSYLAISVVFIDKFGRPFDNVTTFLIHVSLLAFILVLVSNLASYLFAKKNMDKKIHELDNKYREELKTGKVNDAPETVYLHKKMTGACNQFSFIMFFIGVFTIMIYIVLIQINNCSIMEKNCKETRVMTEKKNTQINEGKTEMPKAVDQMVGLTQKGKTEVPQAIINPCKPTTGKTESPQPISKPTPKEKE